MTTVNDPHSLREEIEVAYKASGNTLGWRLLYSPASVLSHANVAFIGLNPGGDQIQPEHPDISTQVGSAYEDEAWGGYPPGESPLQRQVQALFGRLRIRPDQVLAGNLVPFRSPTWKSLVGRDDALAFGSNLWTEILAAARPSLVISMGNETTFALARLLDVKHPARREVGWGRVTATRGVSADAATMLIGLPHLSRFRIITRPESARRLSGIFGEWWS
ncbi:hypothetical protein [Solirhodobacter olei]|uniref:hypothetical protein n=1 Tax=Solirhodobacter olei TaxID=2493082 RepID=UPI000FDB8C02|nr:hypothetical protein [Solirhodobacter olei]